MRGLLLTGCVAISVGVDDIGWTPEGTGDMGGRQTDGLFGVRVGDQLGAASPVTAGVLGDSAPSLLQVEAESTFGAAKQTIEAVLTTLLNSHATTGTIEDVTSKIGVVTTAVEAVSKALTTLTTEHEKALKDAKENAGTKCDEDKAALRSEHTTAMEQQAAQHQTALGSQGELLNACTTEKTRLEGEVSTLTATLEECNSAKRELETTITGPDGLQDQVKALTEQGGSCTTKKCSKELKIKNGLIALGATDKAERAISAECANGASTSASAHVPSITTAKKKEPDANAGAKKNAKKKCECEEFAGKEWNPPLVDGCENALKAIEGIEWVREGTMGKKGGPHINDNAQLRTRAYVATRNKLCKGDYD